MIKITIFILLLHVALNAITIQFEQKDYWLNKLNNIDTRFGYIENPIDILTCSIDDKSLKLYKFIDKRYKLISDYGAFTGKIRGDKLKEGDLKTPLGVYELTEKLTKIPSFYGPLSFVTSYPNINDKYHNKTGYGIWIHGIPKNKIRDKFSRGCIVVNNSDLSTLDNIIDINSILLISDNKKVANSKNIEPLATILAQLHQWNNSSNNNDLNKYVSFYSKDFKSFKKKDLTSFIDMTYDISSDETISNIKIIPYPNTTNRYLVYLKHSKDIKLMLKLNKIGKIEIFTQSD